MPDIPTPTPEPQRAGTTHAGYGEGNPRLLLGHEGWAWDRESQRTFRLDREVTVIGSAPEADIRLEGIAPIHAEIRHDEKDDYVLVLLAEGSAPTVAGGHYVDRPGAQALHAGAAFHIGERSLIFERDEYADHTRPFGGREGGEGAEQTPQRARPDYSGEHDAAQVDEARGDRAP
ncbi:FHA domain-containing protein [Xylanimonas sp. McL0601]|uniref:FHA domain-containing protein n=1 Tax=Xylanimonas sp. McL0601 TaxID=3414739 RepID=UPI003CEAABAF